MAHSRQLTGMHGGIHRGPYFAHHSIIFRDILLVDHLLLYCLLQGGKIQQSQINNLIHIVRRMRIILVY
jgi:hypothetical protein